MFSAFSSTHRVVWKSTCCPAVATATTTACVWWMRREQAVVVTTSSSSLSSSSRAATNTATSFSHRWMTTLHSSSSTASSMVPSSSLSSSSSSSSVMWWRNSSYNNRPTNWIIAAPKNNKWQTSIVRLPHRRWLSDNKSMAEAPTTTTTTTATTTSVRPNNINNNKRAGGGFLQWYEGHLQSRPVMTKMITGSLLWSIGDAVAQLVPQMMMMMTTTTASESSSDDSKNKKNADTSAATTPKKEEEAAAFQYDWPRTARAAFFGFAIHAPTSHVHFNFLEWLTHRVGVTGWKIPFFKAFMEQFVYWSWLSNSMYHGAMGAMQGMTFQQIYNRIADVLWETQKAQWIFWIPVQLLNFQFVPVRHQLNVVLLTSIAWTALLSLWYPPQEEGEDETEAEKQEHKLLRHATGMSTEPAASP